MAYDTAFFLIFTDLDGTLLDHETYEWKEAEPALNRCKLLNIPLILVSSKTRAEINVIRNELGLTAPFISENGGGIFFPPEESFAPPPDTIFEGVPSKFRKWPLGKSYDYIVKSLEEIREELGWKIRGFSDMTPREISKRTGLDLDASRLAAQREYNEPFVILEEGEIDMEDLIEAAGKRELNISTGGRFFHLHGDTDKGEAVNKLISLYRQVHNELKTMGLGDSPNDFSMLKLVHHPVLIRSARHFPGLENEIPNIRVTEEKGVKGWNNAVLSALKKRKDGGVA